MPQGRRQLVRGVVEEALKISKEKCVIGNIFFNKKGVVTTIWPS